MMYNVSPNQMFSGSVWSHVQYAQLLLDDRGMPQSLVVTQEKHSSILRIVMSDLRDQIVQVSYFKKEKHWVPESWEHLSYS